MSFVKEIIKTIDYFKLFHMLNIGGSVNSEGRTSKSGCWSYEKNNNRLYFCQKTELLLKEESEIPPGRLSSKFHKKNWDRLKKTLSNALQKNSTFDFKIEPVLLDNIILLRIFGRAFDNDKIIGSITWYEDSEDDNNQQWMEALINVSFDTIIRFNPDSDNCHILKKGSVLLQNQVLFKEQLSAKIPEQLYKEIKKHLNKKRNKIHKFQLTLAYKKQKHYLSILLLQNHPGTVIIAIQEIKDVKEVTDIEKEKNLLRVIKQFVNGIAHRFNNYLMGILSTLDLWNQEDMTSSQKMLIDRIYLFTRKSQNLVDRLQAYSKSFQLDNKLFNMKDALVNLIAPLTEKRKIHINFIVEADNSFIKGDKHRICSAVQDVIENSLDSMEEGYIQVELKKVKLNGTEKNMIIKDYNQGNYLAISIKDNGIGMTEKQQLNIFDPFYTTKKDFKGHGIGLASVFETISAHNGTIKVNSKYTEGSVFTLYLPYPKTEEDSNEKPPISQVSPLKIQKVYAKTIMLVDDEPSLLEVLEEILKSEDYHTVSFSNSPNAYQYYLKHASDVDLVILDMIMPEMNGKELFLKMKEHNPDIKALMLSGYIYEEAGKDLNKIGFLDILKKPLDRSTLLNTISSHLANLKDHPLIINEDILLAKNRLGNDIELYQRLLQRFYNHFNKSQIELNQFIEKKSYKEAYPRAHQLKNQFNIFGFFNLAKKLSVLETELCKATPQNEKIEELQKEILPLLQSVPSAMNRLLTQKTVRLNQPKNEIELYKKEIDALLRLLQSGLSEHKLNSISEAVEQLDSFHWPPHYRSKITRIKRHCDSKQFTLAEKDLKQIMILWKSE